MREKESFVHKTIKFIFSDIWNKVSWTEIIVICVLIICFMTYIKVNVATYHVACDDGSIVEIHHGTNFVCDQTLEFNSWIGRAQVIPKQIEYNFNFNLTK